MVSPFYLPTYLVGSYFETLFSLLSYLLFFQQEIYLPIWQEVISRLEKVCFKKFAKTNLLFTYLFGRKLFRDLFQILIRVSTYQKIYLPIWQEVISRQSSRIFCYSFYSFNIYLPIWQKIFFFTFYFPTFHFPLSIFHFLCFPLMKNKKRSKYARNMCSYWRHYQNLYERGLNGEVY